jgi:hypothetical protein
MSGISKNVAKISQVTHNIIGRAENVLLILKDFLPPCFLLCSPIEMHVVTIPLK